MAVGDESIGLGATVEIDDGGTGAAPGSSVEEVDALLSIDVPEIKTGTAESKRLGVGRVRKIATIEDGGSWSFKHQFTHTGWERVEAIRTNKQRNEYTVTVPDDNGDTEITVTCLITSNKVETIEADKITEITTTLEVAE
jgi:hypothetical protein